MKKEKIVRLTQLALLSAIIWLMSFTPLGYLKTVGLEISFLMIPVLVGAMLLGPASGAVLGLQFGITSFIQCFGMSSFGGSLLAINPFFTFLVCVPTRVLAGLVPGLLFRALEKVDRSPAKVVAAVVTSLCGCLSNTVFFMGTLVALFWRTEVLIGMQNLLGTTNVLLFIVLFVGVQGVVEIIVAAVVSTPVVLAVRRALRRFA